MSHKDNTKSPEKGKQKIQRPNCKWTSIVLDWPGHIILDNHQEVYGLNLALAKCGYKAESGRMKDGRIKVWRVAK